METTDQKNKQSLIETHSELVKEWHPTKNRDLTPQDVTAGSNKKVWWQCHKGHEWETIIANRTKGSGCPYCAGNLPIVGETDLATTNPELITEWHPTKNGDLTPQDATPKSGKKVWWQCHKGHEWETIIANRTNGNGCPYCSGRYPIKGETDLVTTHPNLAKEWHPTKNGDLTPQDVTAGSNKKVWWQCHKGHEWKVTVSSRSTGTECPYCSGRYPIKGETDLATTHPNLAKEWHPTKNGDLTPQDVTAGSNKKVWWQCHKGHEWEAVVYSRTNGNGCPYCNKIGTSFPEQSLFFYLLKIFPNCQNRYRIGTDEVDIFIPEIDLVIEYDGVHWHKNKEQKDIKKSHRIIQQYKLIRIREKGLNSLEKEKINCIFTTTLERDIPVTINKVFNYILKSINLKPPIKELIKKTKINIEMDRISILENFRHYEYANSLAFLYPNLAKEWHPTNNGQLRPENFRSGSNQKIWWICEHGHEWKATVKNRAKGTECPYCSGRYPIKGETDLATTHPNLAKEWHPTKNGDLTPQQISFGNSKKVWWICEHGHEWEATTNNRSKGNGCPYCSGKKALEGHNDLATTHPNLAKEWHPIKNNDLIPKQVSAGSNKKVWWQCEHGHEWNAIISSRATGHGCPYCSGRYPIKGETDLVTTHPNLAKEWHPTKNGELTPQNITSSSGKKVWWQCHKGHEWEAVVYSRTNGHGCPYCSGRYPIKGETDLVTTHPNIAAQWHPTKNGDLTPEQFSAGSDKKVWWKCQNGHEWNTRITNRKNGTGCPECRKNKQKNKEKQ